MSKIPAYKKNHLKGIDGKYHEVSPEIYETYMQNWWRELAAEKRDRLPIKHKKKSPNASISGEAQYEEDSFPRVASIDSITEAHGEAILPQIRSAESSALLQMNAENVYESLHKALDTLPPEDMFIIQKVFFEGLSGREFEKATGMNRTTMQYRKASILKKLRDYMEVEGLTPDMVRDAVEYER